MRELFHKTTCFCTSNSSRRKSIFCLLSILLIHSMRKKSLLYFTWYSHSLILALTYRILHRIPLFTIFMPNTIEVEFQIKGILSFLRCCRWMYAIFLFHLNLRPIFYLWIRRFIKLTLCNYDLKLIIIESIYFDRSC